MFNRTVSDGTAERRLRDGVETVAIDDRRSVEAYLDMVDVDLCREAANGRRDLGHCHKAARIEYLSTFSFSISAAADLEMSSLSPVAYDEDLADRIREIVGGELGLREQPMFGGLAFLVAGRIAIAVSGQGGVLVRVDPGLCDELVASAQADVAIMGERTMRGWLRVAPEQLRTKRQLAVWVRRGSDYARALPAKGTRKSAR